MPTRGPSHFTKHYTVEEATAMLPTLRQWLDHLNQCQTELSRLETKLNGKLAEHRDMGGKQVNQLVRTLAEADSVLRRFVKLQIQIKDIERGLIDFPSWREGREVFLCWEKDEADIEHWHDLETGYAGREPL